MRRGEEIRGEKRRETKIIGEKGRWWSDTENNNNKKNKKMLLVVALTEKVK